MKLVAQDSSLQYFPKYIPADSSLHQVIVALDRKYFAAYNSCDLDKQASMYAEDLEFYHDKAGLATSKTDIIKAIEENICGKVTRTLVEGSVEVYPIPNFGAIEMGFHSFHNNQEPDAKQKPSRFIVVWKHVDDRWLISRVISLH